MVYSSYKKHRALSLWKRGLRAPSIAAHMKKEGLKVSRRGIHAFLRRYEDHGTIHRLAGLQPPRLKPLAIAALLGGS